MLLYSLTSSYLVDHIATNGMVNPEIKAFSIIQTNSDSVINFLQNDI